MYLSNVNSLIVFKLTYLPCVLVAFLLEVRVHLLVFFAHSFCFWTVAQKNRTVNVPIHITSLHVPHGFGYGLCDATVF